MNVAGQNYRKSVLDHGYVELIEHHGSDERIVESARMSTGKGFLGWGPRCKHCGEEPGTYRHPSCFAPVRCELPIDLGHEDVPGDEKLLRYLWHNKHHTPFEMAGAIFEVQAPIFVLRQWFTHRTQSRNEHSARYGPLPALDYLPTLARCGQEADDNRQAAGAAPFDGPRVQRWLEWLENYYDSAEAGYREALAAGVPKELARLPLTVARYSKMRVSANLRNWLHFLALRNDSHAQREIREFALAIEGALQLFFPRTLTVFYEERLGIQVPVHHG